MKLYFDENSTIPSIQYKYDATGVKLEKSVMNEGTISTQYANGFIYNNNDGGSQKLQFFSHPEGYVEPVGGTARSVKGFELGQPGPTYSSYNYVFQYKDHLGNVRLSYSDADLDGAISPDEIIEESNYYPFGLKQKGYNVDFSSDGNALAQQWKFGNKELQEDLTINVYDFHARNYDPAVGRFMSLDPHAENYYDYTPYNYVANNPLLYIDPDGKDYRLNVYQDDDGKWTMEINSTVHIFSDKGNAKEKVAEYNQFVKDNTDKFRGSFKTEDGVEVAISINIEYVEGKGDSRGKTKSFKDGDNILSLENGVERFKNMGAIGWNRRTGTGHVVVMDSGHDYYSSAGTVHHDVLHQMGLGDRYTDDKNGNYRADNGFGRDLMGLGPQTEYLGEGFEFKQIHFNNYGQTHFSRKATKRTSNKIVDCCSTTKNPNCQ